MTPEVDAESYRQAEPIEIKGPFWIKFDGWSGNLVSPSQLGLLELEDHLKRHPAATLVRIEAHIGIVGPSEERRMQITKDRALTIARWLVDKGIDCRRLLPVGYGSTQLPDRTQAYAPPSERITAYVVGLRGHALRTKRPEGTGEIAGDPCAR